MNTDTNSNLRRRDEYGIIQPSVGDIVYCQSKHSCLFALPAKVVEVDRHGATLDFEKEIPIPFESQRTKRYWAMPLRELDFDLPPAARQLTLI